MGADMTEAHDGPDDNDVIQVGPAGRALHYDREGRPITMRQWVQEYMALDGGNTVAMDVVKYRDKEVHISTVWTGLDHSFGSAARPLIFETSVLGGPLGDKSARYATEEQARVGHQEILDYHYQGLPGRLRYRARRVWDWLRSTGRGIKMVTLEPRTRWWALQSIILWGVALSMAAMGAFRSIMAGEPLLLLWNCSIGALDFYMLVNSVIGLKWRRQRDKDNPPPKRRKLRGRRKSISELG